MKFTVSTKPLQDAINLAIINSNVSKFYRKSCIVQISAIDNVLQLNVEASDICSMVRLNGENDSEGTATVFVDSLIFKQLVSTFDSNSTTISFLENGITLISGSSKFDLPKLVDSEEVDFIEPYDVSVSQNDVEGPYDINKANWKYVKEHQMFALADTLITPVYKRVYVGGEDGNVIVGDYDNSLFTHTVGCEFTNPCLLSDTVINLFTTIPDNSKYYKHNDNYIIYADTDAYKFISEFTPKYESDEGIGSYNSETILRIMRTPTSDFAKVDASSVSKYLGQLDILSKGPDATVKFTVEGNTLKVSNKSSVKNFTISGDCPDFNAEFKSSYLKSVLSNYPNEISIAPMKQDDEVTGIVTWDDRLVTVLGSVE